MANERTLLCGVQGSFHHHISTKFLDEAESDYYGELEEALIHGDHHHPPITSSHGPKKGFVETVSVRPPPTLEIFPSWPMRHPYHQLNTEQRASEQSVGSSSEESAGSVVKDGTSTTVNNTTSIGVVSGDQQSLAQCKARAATATATEIISEPHKGLLVPIMAMPNGGASQIRITTTTTTGGAQQPPPPPIQYDHSHHNADQKRKISSGSTRRDGRLLDPKTLRRLAQNREAARKSRLRKKVYVQQLESSRIRLQQLEQDLQQVRSQGMFLAGCGAGGEISSGATMFNMEYTHWLEKESRHITDLRAALDANLSDNNLSSIVDEYIMHYDALFHLKGRLAPTDAFHLLTGVWTSPAERCFMWMGGFRPSDLIKMVSPHLADTLMEQQVMRLCGLQQSSQQAEEALSGGLEQLHQSLSSTLSGAPVSIDAAADVNNYPGHLMDLAIDKISSLEGFVRQADNLRQQTLHQFCEILTTRQAARCFIVIGEYYRRLRALSSVWATRPREALIGNESASPNTVMDLQAISQSQYNPYSAY